MIRIVILWFLSMFAFIGVSAQNAENVLNRAIATYNSAKGVSADFSVSSLQGVSSGKIEMSGNKFRILSAGVKCWFDGKTQWSYSTATGEVNITTPTVEDMQMSNPYVALSSMKKSCYVYKAYTQVPGYYTLKLVPKLKSNEIKQILLYVTNGSYNISKAYFEMKSGATYTTKISNYKVVSLGESTFRFNKKDVPADAEIIDLR